jgi:DNA-directed RNA polymerase specialized sigma24 family protein
MPIPMSPNVSPPAQQPDELPTTHWSVIARLRGGDAEQAKMALEDLCRAYHYPLYCYIRRSGLPHHDADDVLHEFLSKLLRLDTFGIADAEKGRLRCFLLVALRRFLNTWHRDQLKRQEREISQETIAAIAEAEGRFELEERSHHESPDRLYDRQWAQELLNLVMQRLRATYVVKGRGALFDTLRPVLISGGSLVDHDGSRLAEQLGIKYGTLRTALYRLLDDYREALCHEVMQTVEDESEAKEEYAALRRAFTNIG